MVMKRIIHHPMLFQFLQYIMKAIPCLLLFILFYCIAHLYSHENALVLIPLGASFIVLYTFCGELENEQANREQNSHKNE